MASQPSHLVVRRGEICISLSTENPKRNIGENKKHMRGGSAFLHVRECGTRIVQIQDWYAFCRKCGKKPWKMNVPDQKNEPTFQRLQTSDDLRSSTNPRTTRTKRTYTDKTSQKFDDERERERSGSHTTSTSAARSTKGRRRQRITSLVTNTSNHGTRNTRNGGLFRIAYYVHTRVKRDTGTEAISSTAATSRISISLTNEYPIIAPD